LSSVHTDHTKQLTSIRLQV